MCIAVPGKVIETDGRVGKVDVRGNFLEVAIAVRGIKPGDYVLIHAGCAIEIVKKEQAEEILELLQEMEQLIHA